MVIQTARIGLRGSPPRSIKPQAPGTLVSPKTEGTEKNYLDGELALLMIQKTEDE